MSSQTRFLEDAAENGFNVANLEALETQGRELVRLVARKQYTEASVLADAMKMRCDALTAQCKRYVEYDRQRR
jgi:hypothetical protein